MSGVNLGNAVGYLDLDISKFVSALALAQSKAEGTSSKLSSTFKGLGEGLTTVGKTLTATLTTAVTAAGVAIVKYTSDFDSEMSKVKAISQASGEEFEELREKAKQLGRDTVYSASEVASGMTEMAKAGWSSQQIMDGMSGVLDAASASGEGFSSVCTIVADAITGFGLSASDATRVADLLTQAANSGTIDIADLGESFKYISPLASSMGLSIEEVTTALSAMSMSGIKGSQAGTSLRTTLSRMIKPTKAVKSAMEELGISISDENGNYYSLNNIIGQLRAAFSSLTPAQQGYYATVLSGQEGQAGLLAMLNLTEEEYDALSESMENCSGVAASTAETMLDNLEGKVKLLGSAIESCAISFGDILMPKLESFVEKATAVVNNVEAMSASQKELIMTLAAIAAAIGPVLLVVGKSITTFLKLKETMTAMKTGFTTIKVAMAGASAPILLLTSIVGVLVAAFVTLWNTNESFRNTMTEIWEHIKDTIQKAISSISSKFSELGITWQDVINVLTTIWNDFCAVLAPVFEAAFALISTVIDTVTGVVEGFIDIIVGLFTGDLDQAVTGFGEIFSTTWNSIVSVLKIAVKLIKGIIDGVCSWFDSSFNNLASFLDSIWDGICESFSTVWSEISKAASDVVSDIIDFFAGLPGGIQTWLNTTISNISSWSSNLTSKGAQAASGFINKVTSGIAGLPGKISSKLSSTLSTVASWAGQMASKGAQAASKLVSSVVSGVSSLPLRMVSVGRNIVSGIIRGVSSSASSLISKMQNLASSALKAAQKALGIKSPSRVFRDQVGKWIPEGMVEGVSAALPAATKSIQSSIDKSIGNIKASTTIDVNVMGATANNTFSLLGAVAQSFSSFGETIAKTLDNTSQSLSEMTDEWSRTQSEGLGYIGINGFSQASEDSTSHLKDVSGSSSTEGDTFIFNSPEPIDELEASRQLLKVKRLLAGGFV